MYIFKLHTHYIHLHGAMEASQPRFRKPVVKGAATTMYCAIDPEVSRHSKNGHFFYFNCGPQKPRNLLGSREDLVDLCHKRQLELVKPYM